MPRAKAVLQLAEFTRALRGSVTLPKSEASPSTPTVERSSSNDPVTALVETAVSLTLGAEAAGRRPPLPLGAVGVCDGASDSVSYTHLTLPTKA